MLLFKEIYYRIKEIIYNIGEKWDKLSPYEEDAIHYAHTYINKEPAKYIERNRLSMEFYLAQYGVSINDNYRNGQLDEYDRKVALMVESHKTNTDMVLYRGVCSDIYKLMRMNAKRTGGCDLLEKGFMATSLIRGHEIRGEFNLRIYVPSGTKAVYQGNVNNEQHYYEVDIMHGAKLKIVSIDNEYINCKLLETA